MASPTLEALRPEYSRVELTRVRRFQFERSAHNQPFEEPNAFAQAMLQIVVPLADASTAARTGSSTNR
jgi:hypothetical protein